LNPHLMTLVHLLAVQAVKAHRKGSALPELIRIYFSLTPALRTKLLEALRKICKGIPI